MSATAIRKEIEWLIGKFGTDAQLRRPTVASDGFFGSHESAETTVKTIQL